MPASNKMGGGGAVFGTGQAKLGGGFGARTPPPAPRLPAVKQVNTNQAARSTSLPPGYPNGAKVAPKRPYNPPSTPRRQSVTEIAANKKQAAVKNAVKQAVSKYELATKNPRGLTPAQSKIKMEAVRDLIKAKAAKGVSPRKPPKTSGPPKPPSSRAGAKKQNRFKSGKGK